MQKFSLSIYLSIHLYPSFLVRVLMPLQEKVNKATDVAVWAAGECESQRFRFRIDTHRT